MNNPNNDYVKNMWMTAIASSVFFIGWLFLALIFGSSTEVFLFMSCIVFSIALSYFIRRRMHRKIEVSLTSNLPADMIEVLNTPIKKAPRRLKVIDAALKGTMITYNAAFAFLLYGMKEETYRILEQEEWEGKIPYHQSFRSLIVTLANYFYSEDNFEGLSEARKAKALGTVSRNFPGVKKATESYETFIEIGQILNGYLIPANIHRMEQKFNSKKTMVFQKLLIAWGLANAYVQLDEKEKSEEMLLFCKTKAPHCEVLHQVKKKFEVKSSIANF